MKTSGGKNKGSGLPADAVRFGKQMGVDFAGLEPEAQELWNQLEQLSANDPVEYQRFISQQMQTAKEEGEAEKSGSKSKNKEKDEGFFRPESGFCIEVPTFGGDGLKVREVTQTKVPSKTLYVNICSSKVIEEPSDKAGKKLNATNIQVADGLQIPLVVGPLRQLDAEANAVDVIFNTAILQLCTSQRYFRAQITDLALQWVKEEVGVDLDQKAWKDTEASIAYSGGMGDNKDIPVLFHVHSNDGKGGNDLNARVPKSSVPSPSSSSSSGNKNSSKDSNTLSAMKTNRGILNPNSLLSKLHEDDNEEPTITESNFKLGLDSISTSTKGGSATEKAKPKGMIIEEIGGSTVLEPAPAPIVQPVATDSNHDKSSKPKQKLTFKSAIGRDDEIVTPSEVAKPPSKKEVLDLEELLSRCDDDLAASSRLSDPLLDRDASTILSDLAKTFARSSFGDDFPSQQQSSSSQQQKLQLPPPQSIKGNNLTTSNIINSSSSAASVSINATLFIVFNPRPDIVTVKLNISDADANQSRKAEVVIEGLKSDVSSTALQLQAAGHEVQIISNGQCFERGASKASGEIKIILRLTDNQRYIIETQNITASLKKKQGRFIISCPCSMKI